MSKDQQIISLTRALDLMGDANENVREARGIIHNVIRSLKSERVIEKECMAVITGERGLPKRVFTGC